MRRFRHAFVCIACVGVASLAASRAEAAAIAGVTQAFVDVYVSTGPFGQQSPYLALSDAVFTPTIRVSTAGDGVVTHDQSFTSHAQGLRAAIAARADVTDSGAASISFTAEVSATITNLASAGLGSLPLYVMAYFSAFDRYGLLPIPSRTDSIRGATADDVSQEVALFQSAVTGVAVSDHHRCATDGSVPTGSGIVGASLAPNGFECGVGSPDFSTSSVGLGDLAPGESRNLSWTLSIDAEAWTIGVDAQTIAVPAPGVLPLFATALACLGAVGVVKRRRALALTANARHT